MSDRRAVAEAFAKTLKERYGDRIERVILFGSVARGEPREGSDIDLLVVTPEATHDLQWEIARDATDVLLREGILVSAIAVTAAEWRRGRDTFFGRRVQAEGLALA